MFISQQQAHRGDAEPARNPKVEEPGKPRQRPQRGHVQHAGRAERSRDPHRLRQAVQPGSAVVFIVLASVENVEPAGPQRNRSG